MVWLSVRGALVLLLLTTAGIKILTAGDLLRAGGMLSTPAVIGAAVGFEIFSATVIGVGRAGFAYKFAVAIFSILLFVSGMALWTGQECNCFGPNTARWAPFVVDFACLAGLAGMYYVPRNPTHEREAEPWIVVAKFLGLAAVPAILVGIATWSLALSKANDADVPVWFGENLVGSRFPLLYDFRVQQTIAAEKDALLLLLRPDCRHCQDVSDAWAKGELIALEVVDVVSVSISPGLWTFMPKVVSSRPMGAENEVVVKWSEGEPFVAAPTLIALRGGIVTALKTGDDAVETLRAADGPRQLFD